MAVPFVAAAVAVGFGLLLLSLHRRDQALTEMSDRGHRGAEILTNAYYSLKDVENLHRAYTLTGDTTFLLEHDSARTNVGAQFQRLGELITTPAEAAFVAELDSLGRERIALSMSVIEARRAGGIDSAAAVIASGEGRRVMAEFGQRIAYLSEWLNAFRSAREAEYARRVSMLYWIIGAGTLLSATAAFSSSWAMLRYARGRDAAVVSLQERSCRGRRRNSRLRRRNWKSRRSSWRRRQHRFARMKSSSVHSSRTQATSCSF